MTHHHHHHNSPHQPHPRGTEVHVSVAAEETVGTSEGQQQNAQQTMIIIEQAPPPDMGEVEEQEGGENGDQGLAGAVVGEEEDAGDRLEANGGEGEAEADAGVTMAGFDDAVQVSIRLFL